MHIKAPHLIMLFFLLKITLFQLFSQQSATFNYTGTPQNFVVPQGVCILKVKSWGAGGGGGAGDCKGADKGGNGGGGAYVYSEIAVTPGQTLTIIVGGGGKGGSFAGNNVVGGGGLPGWGNGVVDGGAGGNGFTYSGAGGAGGAASGIYDGNNPILVAGGGGGAGGGSRGGCNGGSVVGGNGGGGGQDGSMASSNCSSVGLAGASSSGNGVAGVGQTTVIGCGGGGGGGGFNGGGGGDVYNGTGNDQSACGGGGGNSYSSGVNTIITNGNGQTPGNNSDPLLTAGLAKGGNKGGNNAAQGGNGLVFISWDTTPPPPPSIIGDSTVCSGESAVLVVKGATSYLWSNGSTNDSITVSPTINTTYKVVTGSSACLDSAFFTIQVFPTPGASISGNTSICMGDSTVLTASGNGNYTWSTGSTNPSITVFPFTDSIFRVLVENTEKCKDSAEVTVKVNPSPVASFNVTDGCLYDTVNLSNNSTISNGTIQSWKWLFGDGTTGLVKTPKHLYTDSAGTYTITLIAISDSGCTDTTQKTVTRFPIPNANFSPDTVCLRDSTRFKDLSTVSLGTINTWSWNFGDGTTLQGVKNPTHLYPLGSYFVGLVVTSDKGCVDDTLKSIGVYPTPTAGFYYTDSCINQQPIAFFDTSKAPLGSTLIKWDWNMGDGNFYTNTNPQHNFSLSNNYAVELVVTTDKSCTDTVQKIITIHPKPTADFTTTITAGCTPVCLTFTDASSGTINSWEWILGNDTTSNIQNPKTCYVIPNSYDISLIATNTFGCKDTIKKPNYITVWALPIPDFIANPETTNTLNTEISFTDLSSGNTDNNNWVFYDADSTIGNTIEKETRFTFPVDTGNYPIKLITTSPEGCVDSVTKYIKINPHFAIYIPNAFTPNQDGINDTFFPKGIGISDTNYTLYIYDRWGEILFISNDKNVPWNGIAHQNGGVDFVEQGVYSWKLEVTDITEKEKKHKFTGTVYVYY